MAGSTADAMRVQLSAWDHLAGDAYAADRALLVAIAEAVDALRDLVAEGAAPLPMVNACKIALDQLRRERPADAGAADSPLGAQMAQWVDD